LRISKVNLVHDLPFLPRELEFAEGLNIITLPAQGGKSFFTQSLIWGLKGHDKKIDKPLKGEQPLKINLEIHNNNENNKNKKIILNRKINLDGSNILHVKPKNLAWIYDQMKEDLGQDMLRYHFDTVHVFSPIERPLKPLLSPIAINYEIGNMDLSILYARLMQVRRMIGREISYLRKKEGVIINNEDEILKQLSKLNAKEESLREQMRALRKRLAQLHRIEGARSIINVLKDRKRVLEERYIRIEQKYKKHKELLADSMKNREKQLLLDIETAENQIREIDGRLALINQKVYVYQQSKLSSTATRCPCCGNEIHKVYVEGKQRTIEEAINDLIREKGRLEDQLAAAHGFYERSLRLLIQIRQDIDTLKALQKELNQIEETLKKLSRVARPGKHFGELKKVENKLREKRNEFSELQKQRGRLIALLEGTPNNVIKKLNTLVQEEAFVIGTLKLLELSIIELLKPVINQINSFSRNYYIDGYSVQIKDDFSVVFVGNDGSIIPMDVVPASIRAMLLIRLKAILTKFVSRLNLLVIDDADRLIPSQDLKELLEEVVNDFQIQVIAVTS